MTVSIDDPVVLVSGVGSKDLENVTKIAISQLGVLYKEMMASVAQGKQTSSDGEAASASSQRIDGVGIGRDKAKRIKIWVLTSGYWGVRTSAPYMSDEELDKPLWEQEGNHTIRQILELGARDPEKANWIVKNELLASLRYHLRHLHIVKKAEVEKLANEKQLIIKEKELLELEASGVTGEKRLGVIRDITDIKDDLRSQELDMRKIERGINDFPIFVQDTDSFRIACSKQEIEPGSNLVARVPFHFSLPEQENVGGEKQVQIVPPAMMDITSDKLRVVFAALNDVLLLSRFQDCPAILQKRADVKAIFGKQGSEASSAHALPFKSIEGKPGALLAGALAFDAWAAINRATASPRSTMMRTPLVGKLIHRFCSAVCTHWKQWLDTQSREKHVGTLFSFYDTAAKALEETKSSILGGLRSQIQPLIDRFNQETLKEAASVSRKTETVERFLQSIVTTLHHGIDQLPLIMLIKLWLASDGRGAQLFYMHNVRAKEVSSHNSSLAATVTFETLFSEAAIGMKSPIMWERGEVYSRPSRKSEGADRDFSSFRNILGWVPRRLEYASTQDEAKEASSVVSAIDPEQHAEGGARKRSISISIEDLKKMAQESATAAKVLQSIFSSNEISRVGVAAGEYPRLISSSVLEAVGSTANNPSKDIPVVEAELVLDSRDSGASAAAHSMVL